MYLFTVDFVEDEVEPVLLRTRRERVFVLRASAALFERFDDGFTGMMAAGILVGRVGVCGQLLFHLLHRIRERALIGRIDPGIGELGIVNFRRRFGGGHYV